MSICTHLRNTARKLGDRLRQERGQSLVEFAMVLPVLVLIILGILYFGRYEDYNNQETQLAEAGVRQVAVNYTPATGTLQSYIRSQAQPELQNGSSDVTQAQVWIYQPGSATYATGQPVRVCVVSTVTFPSPIGSPAATMAQAATMRIEQTNGSTLPYTAGNPGGASLPPSSTNCPTS